jgi:NAD(P)-dependent dehydrogenase (short-subunit alcohol dehydrogenase family)
MVATVALQELPPHYFPMTLVVFELRHPSNRIIYPPRSFRLPEATDKDGLRRLGKAEDVSALVLFLCSEKARHIQRTAIAVDGG